MWVSLRKIYKSGLKLALSASCTSNSSRISNGARRLTLLTTCSTLRALTAIRMVGWIVPLIQPRSPSRFLRIRVIGLKPRVKGPLQKTQVVSPSLNDFLHIALSPRKSRKFYHRVTKATAINREWIAKAQSVVGAISNKFRTRSSRSCWWSMTSATSLSWTTSWPSTRLPCKTSLSTTPTWSRLVQG